MPDPHPRTTRATCAECGAPEADGRTCRDRFDERLALEFSDARAGSVHFHTVACYQLQHPTAFGLGEEGCAGLRTALEDVEVRGVPVSEVRRRMGDAFAGATRVRVREDGPATSAAPRRWTTTIADLGPVDAATHADRVRRWARDVLTDLRDA